MLQVEHVPAVGPVSEKGEDRIDGTTAVDSFAHQDVLVVGEARDDGFGHLHRDPERPGAPDTERGDGRDRTARCLAGDDDEKLVVRPAVPEEEEAPFPAIEDLRELHALGELVPRRSQPLEVLDRGHEFEGERHRQVRSGLRDT